LQFVQMLFVEYHGNFNQNNELNEILFLITESGFMYYIKEASLNYKTPFFRETKFFQFDLQLNIFCFKP